MLLYVYGVIYTILYVMFCKMFIESFTKKRVLGKIYRFLILNGFIIIEYLQSTLFANIMLLKVLGIILCGTFFMWLYFEQKIIKIFILVLLYLKFNKYKNQPKEGGKTDERRYFKNVF